MQTLTPELRDELRAILDAQAPQAEPVVTKQRIYELLLEYRQDEVRDEDGYGYPLVDALTLDGHGIDMGEREVMNIADMLAGELAAPPSPQPTDNTALVEALEAMLHAVCGETGFAACVRLDSGLAYPWPALDAAEEKAQSALRALKSDDTPAASSPGRAVSSEPVWLDVTARPDPKEGPFMVSNLPDGVNVHGRPSHVFCVESIYKDVDGSFCAFDGYRKIFGITRYYPISSPALPQEATTPSVDVNETPVHERQAGLMLTDDTQTPQADLETCPNCEGTGIAGHPDSGNTCDNCSGCGGVQTDPVREAAENLLKTIWFDGPGATDIINMDKVNALRRALTGGQP